AFLPDLASSLNNQSVQLANLGRREEALDAATEAVNIRRRLAKARPDVHQTEYEHSLQILTWLKDVDDNDATGNTSHGD
ncbi:hypothetical protein, partial [Umezawaea sp. NPDC059074]|uniref:hypothetical protein n=1 Tax=Umezawaea sp. NPDC059074 TaxID=3346716 RepID=UPI0036BD86A9